MILTCSNNKGANKLQKIFKSEFEQIVEKYNKLVDEVNLNDDDIQFNLFL